MFPKNPIIYPNRIYYDLESSYLTINNFKSKKKMVTYQVPKTLAIKVPKGKFRNLSFKKDKISYIGSCHSKNSCKKVYMVLWDYFLQEPQLSKSLS